MPSPGRPLSVFVVYSHRDDAWRARLQAQLDVLRGEQVIGACHDRRIARGREWAGCVDDALERADVVLWLVSANLLDSDYARDREMQRALERHDRQSVFLLPVLLGPCDWGASTFARVPSMTLDGNARTDQAMVPVAGALRRMAPAAPAPKAGAVHQPALPPAASPAPIPFSIGVVKLFGFIELGAIEWRGSRAALWRWSGGLLALAVGAAALAYNLVIASPLEEARNLMRRGDHLRAEQIFAAMPAMTGHWPAVAALKRQAAFGVRLTKGEHVRELAPELDELKRAFPDAPDVLVFQGLSAYWLGGDIEAAATYFTRAADVDEAHVWSHFLAADRRLDLAYQALEGGDAGAARTQAAHAQQIIDRAVKRASFAGTQPSYANQVAALQDFVGQTDAAYQGFAQLAALHPLSALQAALLAWRLVEPEAALRNSQEAVEGAIQFLERQPAEQVAREGWALRLDATHVLAVYPRDEKLCLLGWVQQLSRALQGASDSAATPVPAQAPQVCGSGLAARRSVELVCVQALTAQARLPVGDPRAAVLAAWRQAPLACPADLQPLRALPPATTVSSLLVPKAWGGTAGVV